MTRFARLSIACAAFVFIAATTSAADWTAVGVWRDQEGDYFDRQIHLVAKGRRVVAISIFPDGSRTEHELRELRPPAGASRAFEQLRSTDRALYIIDDRGNLDLYDIDGFIREARRLK